MTARNPWTVSCAAALIAASNTGAATQAPLPAGQFFDQGEKNHVTEPAHRLSRIRFGDFDGRSGPDVLLDAGQFEVRLHRGQGRFEPRPSLGRIAASGPWGGLLVADFDGDADDDVVVVSNNPLSPGIFLLRSNGGLLVEASGAFPPIGSTVGITLLLTDDLDGDGDKDVIAGGSLTAPRIFDNDGTGRFVDGGNNRHPFGWWSNHNDVLVDLDGDGDRDWLRSGLGPIEAALNDGRGRFTPAPFAVGPPGAFGIGPIHPTDLDGDGDQDLVVSAPVPSGPRLDPALWFLFNDGSGAMSVRSPRPALTLQRAPRRVLTHDLDGDGSVEVLVFDTERCVVGRQFGGLLVDVTSRFLPDMQSPCLSLELADLDGDGRTDAVGSDIFGRMVLLFGSPGGVLRLASAPRALDLGFASGVTLVTADLDRDGIADVVGAGSDTFVARGDQRGRIRGLDVPSLQLNGLTTGLLAADLTGDPVPEILGLGRDSTLLGFDPQLRGWRDLTPQWLPANLRADGWRGTFADVDLDGNPDLIWLGTTVQAVLQHRGGSFVEIPQSFPNLRAQDLAVLDVEGDGDPDLAVLERVAGPQLFVNDGTGRFTRSPRSTPSHPSITNGLRVVASDLDSDGDPDLLFSARHNNENLHLWRNDGAGNFTIGPVPPVPVQPVTLLATDVDLDGDDDVIAGTTLLVNDGAGSLTHASPNRSEGLTISHPITSFDVDRDGDPDLVGTGLNGRLNVWINTHRHLHVPYLDVLGGTGSIELFAAPTYATAPVLVIAALAPTALNTGLELPPFGMLAIDPTTAVTLPPVAVTGRGAIAYRVPLAPALAGTSFFAQALFVDRRTAVLSNLAAGGIRF